MCNLSGPLLSPDKPEAPANMEFPFAWVAQGSPRAKLLSKVSLRCRWDFKSRRQSQSLGLGLFLLWLQKNWVYHERFSNKNLNHTQHFIFISFICSVCWGQLMLGLLAHQRQGMLSGKRPVKTAHQKLNRGPALFSTKFPETETKWISTQSWQPAQDKKLIIS